MFKLNILAKAMKSLSFTPPGHLRMSCTRINPRHDANDPRSKVTLPMNQLTEYAYLKTNGAFVVKFFDKPELTFYPSEIATTPEVVPSNPPQPQAPVETPAEPA